MWLVALGAGAGPPDRDAGWDLEERIAAVNEGELRFLDPQATTGAHAHLNRIRIDLDSLSSGWVRLRQCHENLDAVPATEVVFRPGHVRGLRLESAHGIDRAWAEGHRVLLESVSPGARLCISAETRALHRVAQGRYRLRNGPYMRRFLDGFYPMRVVLHVDYPAHDLRLVSVYPPPQRGLSQERQPGRIELEASFEGALRTCIDFATPSTPIEAAAAPPCDADAPTPFRD